MKIAPWRLRKAMLQLGLASWADPDATTAVLRTLREYCWWDMFPKPQKGKDGQPKRVTRGVLAALLADYRNAQERGWKRDSYLSRTAREEYKFVGSYSSVAWTNAETIRGHLCEARQLYKSDETFRKAVNFERTVRRWAKVGAAGWIDKG